jgi:hypothetical protein
MRNPAIAIQCGGCLVPIAPVLHPQPDTLISCPKCGASEPYSTVWAVCMEEVKTRPIGKGVDLRAPARWRFRA